MCDGAVVANAGIACDMQGVSVNNEILTCGMEIKMNHLSIEEIEKVTDTSDLSAGYLTWYESVEKHIADCPLCREQIRRKILCDELADGFVLQEGISLLEKEEEIRRNIVISRLLQQSTANRAIADALRKQQYDKLSLVAGKSSAVYRGETEQKGLNYEWQEKTLKVIISSEQFSQTQPENAKVILMDGRMNVKVEKVSVDENGVRMASFENVERIDDATVYIVED